MRKARLAYEYWSYPSYIVEHRYGRITRRVEIHDGVAKDWYDKDWEELPELNLMRDKVLREGSKVFDIGAHQCVVAMMLADMVGQTGHVWAWEPVKANAQAGRRNIELNSIRNCTVVDGAVGSLSGEDTELGRIYTIDEMAQQFGRPDLIMVDVEGFEYEALKGAPQTLREKRNWLIEIHRGAGLEEAGSSAEEVIGVFQALGGFDFYVGKLDNELHPWQGGALPESRFMFAALAKTAVST